MTVAIIREKLKEYLVNNNFVWELNPDKTRSKNSILKHRDLCNTFLTQYFIDNPIFCILCKNPISYNGIAIERFVNYKRCEKCTGIHIEGNQKNGRSKSSFVFEYKKCGDCGENIEPKGKEREWISVYRKYRMKERCSQCQKKYQTRTLVG